MPRVRNYRLEYQQRLTRALRRAEATGQPFNRAAARGHGNTEQERLGRQLRYYADKTNTPRDEVKEATNNTGKAEIVGQLKRKLAAMRAYRKGNPTPGRTLWIERTGSTLPEIFYWYHGG